MKMKLLLLVLAALAAINSYGQNRGVAYVDTLAVLDAMRPQPGMTVYVRGATNVNDWGDKPLPFAYSSTSSNATDRFCRATATGVGRWLYEWDGNVTAFGAVPYQPRYTLAPWGYFATNSAIGTGAFSVYCQVDFPASYTQPVGMFEISPLQATNYNTAVVSSFGMRASPENWGFVFRSTSGSSGAGVDTNGAAVLDSTPAAVAAYAGQTVNVVVTRSGTNAAVYFNGTDVTSLFTFSNPLGWSKPLAFGQDIQMQVGNNVNPWYWPKPLRRFILFNSALNASQAANPAAQSGKLIDFTPEDTTEPTDLTDEVNAAGDYVASKGGGRIFFPPGVYNISGNIRVNQRIWWQGSGSSTYPGVFNQGFRPGSTVINLPFGASNFAFYGSKDQGTELSLSRRYLGQLGGWASARYLRSRISDLVIIGVQAYSSDAMFFDRVGDVAINNVSFFGIPGHEIRGYGCNVLNITSCGAVAGRGFAFHGCADMLVQQNFLDSPKGPALRWACNLSKAINNTFEVSQNSKTVIPAYQSITTVNTATDEFTVTNYYGHRLLTGQTVRFDEWTNGVLPSPVTTNVDYFAIVTGRDTFKLSLAYGDEALLTGAIYSNAIVDITTTGSNTWYSGVAQSFNFHISGDHNAFVGNHGQQGYDGGMLLEGSVGVGGNNSIVGNSLILSGYENPRSNLVAGIVLRGSSYNSIVGNQLDDRDNSLYSQNGVIGDANALYNQFIGNSWNVANPYTLAAPYRNTIMDAQYVQLSAGNVYLSDGITGSNTNIYYAIRANNASTVRMHADAGTLSITNSGTGQKLLEVDGSYGSPLIEAQVNSLTDSQSSEFRFYKNYSTNSGTLAAPPAYHELGEIQWAAPTSSSSEAVAASILVYVDGQSMSTNSANSQMNLQITPANSVNRLTGLLIQYGATNNLDISPLAVASTDGTNWRSAGGVNGYRIRYHTNDSGGSGFRTLIVPNK